MKYFEDWTKKYGPAYEIPGPFGSNQVVICDPKAMAHFYGGDTWNYVQPAMVRIFLENLIGKGLLIAEGESHKRQRKALTPAFSIAQIRELTTIFYDAAYKLKSYWDSKIDNDSSGSIIVDVQAWMNNVSLDSIGIAGFGHDFHALDGQHTVVPDLFNAFSSQERNGVFSTLVMVLSPFIPWLQHLPTSLNRALKEVRQGMAVIADDLMARSRKKDGDNVVEEKSILGLLIRAEGSADTFGMTQEEVLAQMNLLLLAGYETTAISLTWSLIELSRHPDKQERLRKELLQVSSSDPTYDTLSSASSFPYLDAIVHEVLLLHPTVIDTHRVALEDDVIPFLQPVTTATGAKVDRIAVKKGTFVISPLVWMNTCEEFWGKRAKEFVPERWLDEKEEGLEVANEVQGYRHILTFSDGPRTCLGKNFALAEFKTVLSMLIRHYTFEFPDGPDTVIEKYPSLVPRPRVTGFEGPKVPLRVRRVE